MKKQSFIFFGSKTWERLKALGLPHKSGIEYKDGFVQVPARKGFGTSPSRLVINDSSGRFHYSYDESSELRLGKLLRSIYPDLKPHQISELTQLWSALYSNDELIKAIQVSDCLSEVYDLPHYQGGNGSISHSCMRGKGEFYRESLDPQPDIRIAFLVNAEGELIGRAILWERLYVHDGDLPCKTIKFMDRIYYANGRVLKAFKRWAVLNGYWYKAEQDHFPYTPFVSPDGETYHLKVVYELPEPINVGEYVPYMDTLCFTVVQDNYFRFLTNDEDYVMSNYEAPVVLNDTCGRWGYCGMTCPYCGYLYNEEDLYYVEGYDESVCEACLEEYFIWSVCCGCYIHRDDAVYCETCNDYHHENDVGGYIEMGPDENYYHYNDPVLAKLWEEWEKSQEEEDE